MSAIAGVYYLDGQPVERAELVGMLDTLAHHGTDASGLWHDGVIGLGHQMLWTTPESLLEKLPFVNQRGDLVITANARIDNRDELISALRLHHQISEKITDSQLILESYEKWGEHCTDYLMGDFVFAIWDIRQQALFCARDVMGVKPFYYYRSHRLFAFASEIKALLALPGVPCQLNEIKVADHLAHFCEDQSNTFYQDIVRLPAAHSLTVSRTRTQLQAYWALDPAREVRLRSDAEYVEAFRAIFTEAVQCRLRSAFPIGSTLSGGLDSSSIACTARQLLTRSGHQLHTFSAIFPGLPPEELRIVDERDYMQAVQAIGGFKGHDVRADHLSPLAAPLWQDDEVALAPNLYIHEAMYRCAQQNGVRIFLDGFDGDSTVSHGWRYLTELFYTGRWNVLLAELAAVAGRYHLPRRHIFWQFCLKPLLTEPLQVLWQRVCKMRQTLPPGTLIHPGFAKRIGLADRIYAQSGNLPSFSVSPKHDHWASLRTGLYPYALEVADKVTAQFTLEARYPFFDRRLIEFCFALPASQKFRQGWTRAILRHAMTDTLPNSVQWRIRKSNLSPNFNRQLLESERSTLEGILRQPDLIRPYVDLSTLQAAYERYTAQPQQQGQDAIALFSVMIFALWLRRSPFNPA